MVPHHDENEFKIYRYNCSSMLHVKRWRRHRWESTPKWQMRMHRLSMHAGERSLYTDVPMASMHTVFWVPRWDWRTFREIIGVRPHWQLFDKKVCTVNWYLKTLGLHFSSLRLNWVEYLNISRTGSWILTNKVRNKSWIPQHKAAFSLTWPQNQKFCWLSPKSSFIFWIVLQ